MEADAYFADEAVRIGASDAQFGGRVYPISELGAVRLDTRQVAMPYGDWRDKVRLIGLALLATGFLLWTIVTVLVLVTGAPSRQLLLPIPFTTGYFSASIIMDIRLGLLAAGAVIVCLLPGGRERYIVRLVGSFGVQDVVVARNRKYAKQVERAIKTAIKNSDSGR